MTNNLTAINNSHSLQLAAAKDVRRFHANVEMLKHLNALNLGLGRLHADAFPRIHELFQTIEGFAAGKNDAILVDGDLRGHVVILVVSKDLDVDAAKSQLAA